MGKGLSYIPEILKAYFVGWPQGRPLGYFLPALFSATGDKLGGLHAIYMIGFTIVVLNSFLFYLILRRRFQGSEVFALAGALSFCLFPPDTTKALLTHSLILQPSLTFLLIASLCYLSGREKLSYLIITGSLLTYESAFMVFLGAPLLKEKWGGKHVRTLVRHIVILSLIVLCAIIVRKLTGEVRIVEMGMDIPSLLKKISASIFIGPAMIVFLFLRAPAVAVYYWDMGVAVVFIACLAVFLWRFYRLKTSAEDKRTYAVSIHSRVFSLSGNLMAPAHYSDLGRLFAAAAVMLCLAYLTSFTHFPPIAYFGRMTSVHLAATFGGSLLFACIWAVTFSVAGSYRRKGLAIGALAVYLSLIAGYNFIVQKDFVKSWQNQKAFWSAVVDNCPDLEDGTVILVAADRLPQTKYIATHSWADPIVLTRIYRFPENWKSPPRLFVVSERWMEDVTYDGGQFIWDEPYVWGMPPGKAHRDVLPDSNVILLEMADNELTRKSGPVSIKRQTFNLKKKQSPASVVLEKGVLHKYLVQDAK